MRCTHCGANIPDDQLICPVCGAEVQIVPDYNPLEDVLAREVKGSVAGATRQIQADVVRRQNMSQNQQNRNRQDQRSNPNSTRVLSQAELDKVREERREQLRRQRAQRQRQKTDAKRYQDARQSTENLRRTSTESRRLQQIKKQEAARKKRQKLLTVFFLLILLVGVGIYIGYQNSYTGMIKKGNAALQNSNYTSAENYFNRAIIKAKEFFQKLREGHMSVTSQINPEEAREMLEPFVKEGKDVLHLGFSSGLSGTYNSMRIAAEELAEDYPEAKIIVIDTLCACLGEGLLLYYALKLKEEGKTIDEIAKWAEENKLHVCHNVTVDDLNHLQRGGRISKAAAVLGTLVQVKPIIHMDNNGKLQVIAKERGRKKSLNKIVDMAVEQSKGWENEIIMITHGDCLKDAEYVAGRVREKMGIENILINNIGTVIGSHTGPGVVAVFCMGNER